MWYQRTPQGFIRVFSDPTPPKDGQGKEVSKQTLAQLAVDYNKELKKRRDRIKELLGLLGKAKALISKLKEENERLKKELQAANTGQKLEHVSDISLSSMINEVRRRTDNKAKLAIFKQIVDDNVELRQQIKNGD